MYPITFDGTGAEYYVAMADEARDICQHAAAHREKGASWGLIFLEEVYEALAESDPVKLRAELVQVAAVCAAWIWDLENRAAEQPAAAEHVHKLGNADEDGGILDDWDNCRDPHCPGPAAAEVARARQAAGQPEADTCRPVEVDGETVLVRGNGTLTEEEQGLVADAVRAARRKYDADPKCPSCGHLWAHHSEDVCGVRSRHQGRGYSCGCTAAESDFPAVRQPAAAPTCHVEFIDGSRCAKPLGHRLHNSDDPHVSAARQPDTQQQTDLASDETQACGLCAVVKPSADALRDHMLNVHPEQFEAWRDQEQCRAAEGEATRAAEVLFAPLMAKARELKARERAEHRAEVLREAADAVLELIGTEARLPQTISGVYRADALLRRLADEAGR